MILKRWKVQENFILKGTYEHGDEANWYPRSNGQVGNLGPFQFPWIVNSLTIGIFSIALAGRAKLGIVGSLWSRAIQKADTVWVKSALGTKETRINIDSKRFFLVRSRNQVYKPNFYLRKHTHVNTSEDLLIYFFELKGSDAEFVFLRLEQ